MDPYRPVREELGRISGTLERGLARKSQGATARTAMELGHEARMAGFGMQKTRLGLAETKHEKEMELFDLRIDKIEAEQQWLDSPTAFKINLGVFQEGVGPEITDKVTRLISENAEVDEQTGDVTVPTTNRSLINNLKIYGQLSKGMKLQASADGKVFGILPTGQTFFTGITAALPHVPYSQTQEGVEALIAGRKDVAGAKAGARKDLTLPQQINLKQKTFAEKKDINEAFEVEYPKPLRPLKAKELPEYNKQMQSWSLAQTTNEYEKMKDYYTSVLGEKASEQINKKAMAAGKKLYTLSSKIENRDEKKVFLQELRNISPDLYEIHKAIDRKNLETKTEKPPDKPTEEPPKKMTEKELREALYKKTGDRSVLFSTHKPLEKAREAIGKAGRGIGKAGREALSFVNRPMTEEERKNLPRYSQGLR